MAGCQLFLRVLKSATNRIATRKILASRSGRGIWATYGPGMGSLGQRFPLGYKTRPSLAEILGFAMSVVEDLEIGLTPDLKIDVNQVIAITVYSRERLQPWSLARHANGVSRAARGCGDGTEHISENRVTGLAK
jgi:hypothetical protein